MKFPHYEQGSLLKRIEKGDYEDSTGSQYTVGDNETKPRKIKSKEDLKITMKMGTIKLYSQ